MLLFNPNQPKTFHSAVWNTFTNPDLSFFMLDRDSVIPHPMHTILGNFPKSQHRPTLIYHPALIEYTPTAPIPRWNFGKADWDRFRDLTRDMCTDLPDFTDINTCYSAFQKKLSKIAKRSIPRGFRKNYIPEWDDTCENLSSQLEEADSLEEKTSLSNQLIDHLDAKRRQHWITTVENVDMKSSSRRAWSTLNKLTGRKNVSPNPNSMNPNSVASCLLSNGKFKNPNKEFTRDINRQLKEAWCSPSVDQNLCSEFSADEMFSAIKTLKAGKAPGVDNLHPEFFLHMDDTCLDWLREFFNHCLKTISVPKIWKLSKVVAVLKPKKPPDNPSSYRPISLLCIPLKLYERLIYNRIQPITESFLPNEQAGFRPGRSCLDQAALLTEDIEHAFDQKLKAGIVLVDLSAAYDTVWHRGLTLKLLKTIPSRQIVRVIMSMISQRRFHVHIGGKKSRCRTLINGVPQGSVIAPLLFNIYTHDLPPTVSKKYVYADDLALKSTHKDFPEIEEDLSKDVDSLRSYFTNWRLKLNTGKTVSSVFHLANRKANYELNVTTNGEKLRFERNPVYLGVTLDRTLSFNQHLTNVSSKITKRCNLLRRLAGNRWGADFTTLRTSALALCYSTAEYCSPIWSHSPHCNKIDVSLNSCMRVISGCIKSTHTEILPVLCGIAPSDIRRNKNTLDLRDDHMLNMVANNPLLNGRLKSRSPLSRRMHSLAADNTENVSPQTWAEAKWRQRWNDSTHQLKQFIPLPSNKPPGHDLKRHEWVLLNRIRSGYGRYGSFMHRIGLSNNPNCVCGEIQTPQHVLVCQTIGIRGDIKTVDDDFRNWIDSNNLDI